MNRLSGVEVKECFNTLLLKMSMAMEEIPSGAVWMGKVQRVRVKRPFLLGRYPVTQALWESVKQKNPSRYGKGLSQPVRNVSFYHCVDFCNMLSQKEDLKPFYLINKSSVNCDWMADGYRLPTEAEWEHAVQYQSKRKGYKVMNGLYHWQLPFNAIGQGEANIFGLYDMTHMIWQWCNDGYDKDYWERGQFGPVKEAWSRIRHVIRGGERKEDPLPLRGGVVGKRKDQSIGFRLCRTVFGNQSTPA